MEVGAGSQLPSFPREGRAVFIILSEVPQPKFT